MAKKKKKKEEKISFNTPKELAEKEKDLVIDLPIDEKEKLKAYLAETIENIEKEKETFLKNTKKWRDKYEGKKKPKNFPFPGCSNIAVPIPKIHTDSIWVRFWDNILSRDDIAIIKPRKSGSEWVEKAQEIQEYINWYINEESKLKDKLRHALKESIKLGTGSAKVSYEIDYKSVFDQVKKGKNYKVERKKIKAFEGIKVYPIRIEDVGWRSDCIDLDECDFIYFRFTRRPAQIEKKVNEKFYNKEEAELVIGEKSEDRDRKYDEETEQRVSRAEERGIELKSETARNIYLYEIWFDYYLKLESWKKPEMISLVATFHKKTKALLRLIINPFFTSLKPFTVFSYDFVEYSLYGKGVPETTYHLSEGIDTLLNQTIDNNRIKNCLTLWVREDQYEKLSNIQLMPGAKFTTPDKTDFEVINWGGDVLPSSFSLIELLYKYAEEATGVVPSLLGKEQVERPTATGTVALLQEANKKLKVFIEGTRMGFSRLLKIIVLFMKQFNPYIEYTNESGEEGILNLLDIPIEVLDREFVYDLSISSDIMNQEVEKQMQLSLYQLLRDFYDWITQMAQVILMPPTEQGGISPAFKAYLIKVIKAEWYLMKKILTTFGQKDIDALLPEIPEILTNEALEDFKNQLMMLQQQAQQVQETGQIPTQQGEIPPEEVPPEEMPPEGEVPPEQLPPEEMGY